MRIRICVTTFLLVCACSGTQRRTSSDGNTLAAYVVKHHALEYAAVVIRALVDKTWDASTISFAGVNPGTSPQRGAFGIYFIDAHRMAEEQCRVGNLSNTCRIGRLAVDTCAAVTSEIVVCDASFVSIVLQLAVHDAFDGKLRGKPGEVDGRAVRFDDFFAATYAPQLSGRFAASERMLADLDRETEKVKRDAYNTYAAYLDLVLLHEVGHILLGHIRCNAVGDGAPPTTNWFSSSGPEVEADAYAIKQLAQEPDLLAVAVLLYTELDKYTKRIAALEAGMPNGRLHGPRRSALDRVAWSHYYARLTCEGNHPSYAARVARATSAPEFARAAERWPVGYFKEFVNEAEIVSWLCGQRQSDDQNPLVKAIAADATSVRMGWDRAVIRLIDAGGADRTPLRYVWTKGGTQLIQRSIGLERSEDVSGFPRMPSKRLELSTVLGVGVLEAERGHASVVVQILDAKPPIMNGADIAVVWNVDDRGEVDSVKLFSPARTEEQALLVAALPDYTLNIIQLPEEPLGVGAMWEVDEWVTLEAIVEATRTTTYRLVSRMRNSVLIQSTSRVTPKTPAVRAPNELVKVEAPLDMTQEVDLTQPAPAMRRTETYDFTLKNLGRDVRRVSRIDIVQELRVDSE